MGRGWEYKLSCSSGTLKLRSWASPKIFLSFGCKRWGSFNILLLEEALSLNTFTLIWWLISLSCLLSFTPNHRLILAACIQMADVFASSHALPSTSTQAQICTGESFNNCTATCVRTLCAPLTSEGVFMAGRWAAHPSESTSLDHTSSLESRIWDRDSG